MSPLSALLETPTMSSAPSERYKVSCFVFLGSYCILLSAESKAKNIDVKPISGLGVCLGHFRAAIIMCIKEAPGLSCL